MPKEAIEVSYEVFYQNTYSYMEALSDILREWKLLYSPLSLDPADRAVCLSRIVPPNKLILTLHAPKNIGRVGVVSFTSRPITRENNEGISIIETDIGLSHVTKVRILSDREPPQLRFINTSGAMLLIQPLYEGGIVIQPGSENTEQNQDYCYASVKFIYH